jgi:hypothetical protein
MSKKSRGNSLLASCLSVRAILPSRVLGARGPTPAARNLSRNTYSMSNCFILQGEIPLSLHELLHVRRPLIRSHKV